MTTHRHSLGGKYTSSVDVKSQFTAAEVTALKALLAASGSGGGTTPEPNEPPPPPPPDVTAPLISGIAISAITTTGFTVSWTTNEAATGIVEYGTGTGYGSQTAATSSGTSHSRTISGLVSQTTYHFRVRATDTAGNGPTLSSDRTATTSFVSGGGTPYVTVASISALKAALAVNANTEIVTTTDTYHVSPATYQAADSLWIGAAFAARTNPILIHPSGSPVTLDGGNSAYWCAIAFEEGAHHQTWQGFVFANGIPTHTGIIIFGAYPNAEPHHISLLDLEMLPSLRSSGSGANDHGIYFSSYAGYGHVIDGLVVTATASDGLDSAVHAFHGPSNVRDTVIRNFTVTGNATMQGLIVWEASVANLTFEDGVIGTAQAGVRYEAGSTVTLRRVRTLNTDVGFSGTQTPTYDGCRFDVPTQEIVLT